MKVIRIFISSPGDVADERDKAEAVIRDLDRHYSGRAQLVVVRWENLGLGAQASFQEGIVKVLTAEGGVDVAVFIMWSRLGTPQGGCALRPDGKPYRSGTEQETSCSRPAARGADCARTCWPTSATTTAPTAPPSPRRRSRSIRGSSNSDPSRRNGSPGQQAAI